MTFDKKIIQAEPDYYAIDFCKNQASDGIILVEVPVIAWCIQLRDYSAGTDLSKRTSVEPVCIDGLSDLYEGAIQAPDGRVFIRFGDIWRDIHDYRKHVKERYSNWVTLHQNKVCVGVSNAY